MKRLIKKGIRILMRVKDRITSLTEVVDVARMPSYYPEQKRKSFLRRVWENVLWVLKYAEVNKYYTLYGFDLVGSVNKEFIDYLSFMESRDEMNQIKKWGGSQTAILRDKFLFYKYMKGFNLPVADVFAFVQNGDFFDTDFHPLSLEEFKEERDYFLKEIDGECASFVKHIHSFEDLNAVSQRLKHGIFILQRRISQCTAMSELNPGAINTLRIITVHRNAEPYVLSALLRVGTAKTGNVDNWSAGGLAVGIQEDGYLKQYGFYKPGFGTKTECHPDTGVQFSEFQIPMYASALKAACEAHKVFYGLRAIGWDIAITDNGPVFIEGNDNFAITLNQACDRPLKTEWWEAMQ